MLRYRPIPHQGRTPSHPDPGIMHGDEASGGKRRLEVLVCEEGGTVVQNPTPSTFCVIADEGMGDGAPDTVRVLSSVTRVWARRIWSPPGIRGRPLVKIKVSNVIKSGLHDILRSNWLLQSVEQRTRLPLQQRFGRVLRGRYDRSMRRSSPLSLA